MSTATLSTPSSADSALLMVRSQCSQLMSGTLKTACVIAASPYQECRIKKCRPVLTGFMFTLSSAAVHDDRALHARLVVPGHVAAVDQCARSIKRIDQPRGRTGRDVHGE